MDIKWDVILIGFLLSIALPIIFEIPLNWFGRLIGLAIAGFLVGYIIKGEIMNGFLHATISGAIGGLLTSILLFLAFTFFGGVIGLLVGSFLSAITAVVYIFVSAISMGIFGAIGSYVAMNYY